MFGYDVSMSDETHAKKTLTAASLENWQIPPGCPRITRMKTIQQDLKSLDEAINVAQKCPLWKLISMFGATHYLWCMPEKRKRKKKKKNQQQLHFTHNK